MENDSQFIEASTVVSLFRSRFCHPKEKNMEYFNLLRGMLRYQWDCLNIDLFASCVTKSARLARTVVISEEHNSGCGISKKKKCQSWLLLM